MKSYLKSQIKYAARIKKNIDVTKLRVLPIAGLV
jgi:hypothetical protein